MAQTYCGLIRTRHELTEKVNDADILLLHQEPHNFDAMYQSHPVLKNKYVIAYCVWEASELPDSYKRSIALVQEIWSCSEFSCSAFRKYHPNVIYMPHVIKRDTGYSDYDRLFVQNAISYRAGDIYFLAVTKVRDKRKNVNELAKIFQRRSAAMPNARLIIKGTPGDPVPWLSHPQILYLPLNFTRGQINCLYELGHIYISAHHSEAWGLTLSDAMIFGKPVIATGFSGNLEFMNENNSFLLEYEERFIDSQDCCGLFTDQMKWAYPHEDDLGEKLVFLYNNLYSDVVTERVKKASADISAFDETTVGHLVLRQLSDISHRVTT